jgi:hypothetical protein
LKPSPYKVGVVFGFTKKGNTFKSFEFMVDRNRFEATLSGCKTNLAVNPKNLVGTHMKLIELVTKQGISFEYMCTLILNYLCYLPQTAKLNTSLQNQSLGFIIDMETAPIGRISFWGGTMKELEKITVEFNKGKQLN